MRSFHKRLIAIFFVALALCSMKMIKTYRKSQNRNHQPERAAWLSTNDICLPFEMNSVAQGCTSFKQTECLLLSSCNISAPTFNFSPVRYYNETFCGRQDISTQDYTERYFWEKVASNLGMLAESEESACLTLLYMKPQHYAKHNQPPCRVQPTILPESQWGGGQGVAFISNLDKAPTWWPELLGRPIQLASHMLKCFYRENYDISIPLFYNTEKKKKKVKVYHELYNGNSLPPDMRAFFLTVQASAYPEARGAARLSLTQLHNPGKGVVVQLSCKAKSDPSKICQHLNDVKEQNGIYEYDHLMNTTFALVPEGRSPATYRLNEVLAAGAIPVFFGDTGNCYTKPFSELVDWEAMSLSFTTGEVNDILSTLRAIDGPTRLRMQALGQEAFRSYFESNVKMATTMLTLLGRRVQETATS
mmetsp:Transcript_23518/g.35359  ORF Transcript_23518/g.35359 Transcript_23518/m.35359 type:complete len:418 (-) Transcript_23518:174-1427(-)